MAYKLTASAIITVNDEGDDIIVHNKCAVSSVPCDPDSDFDTYLWEYRDLLIKGYEPGDCFHYYVEMMVGVETQCTMDGTDYDLEFFNIEDHFQDIPMGDIS